MTESYPELTRGTVYTNNYGLWCVVNRDVYRMSKSYKEETTDIAIEVMALDSETMEKGDEMWLHEDDIESPGSGEAEIVDTSKLV